MQRRYLLAIIIFVVFVIVAVSGFLFVKHLNEKKLSDDEKQFFDMKWISFCGRINSKQWVSHNAVNNVANKILQIKNSYPTKKRKKIYFHFLLCLFPPKATNVLYGLIVNISVSIRKKFSCII